MSPKDFFRIVIKVIALLVITNGIIPAVTNFFAWYNKEAYSVFILLGSTLFLIAIIYVLVSFTDSIINFFKLDKGFDSNKFDLVINSDKKILSIACVIIGLNMIFSSLPQIVHEGIIFFRDEVSNTAQNSFSVAEGYYFYYNVINVVLGLLVIGFRSQIGNLFTSNTDK